MDIKSFKSIVDSLNQYHRITSEKLAGDSEKEYNDELVKELYVDLLPNNGVLEYILEKRTSFLVGRRGTGKSTVFARAQQNIREDKKNLSVYINAKSIFKKSQATNLNIDIIHRSVFTNDELFKISLIDNAMKYVKESLLEELQMEENNWWDKFTNKFRNADLEKKFNEIQNLIDNPMHKNIVKTLVEEKKEIINDELIASIKSELKGDLVNSNLSTELSGKLGSTESTSYENVIAKVFNIGNIIAKFIDVLKICNRKHLFIFIDDYSELDRSSRQLFMQTIIDPFYNLGTDKLFIKISAYPNRYDPVTLETNKYSVKIIDLYEIYGKNQNIPETEKKSVEYTKKLLENRVKNFSSSNIEDYFDTSSNDMNEFYKLLYYASKNIPRTIGGILNQCYQMNIIYGKKITAQTLKDCSKLHFEENTITYFNKRKSSTFEDIDDKIDVFVQETLLDDLIQESQKNRYVLPSSSNSYFNDLPEAYTSHFTVANLNAEYIETLEFNGFVHRSNTIAAKGRGVDKYNNNTNFLYAFDYGLCESNKILYGKPEKKDTKYFQQRAFQMDDVIINSLSNNKKIQCKNCKSEFDINELETFKRFQMKCTNCQPGFCEIVFDKELKKKAKESMKASVYSIEEIEVLHTLMKLLLKDKLKKVTARMLSLETDYNSYTIAWKCKRLEEAGFVERHIVDGLYWYAITERGDKYIKNIVNTN